MILTTSYHAILVAIGIFPAQATILESYEATWENLPPGVKSIWEFILEIEDDPQSLNQVFSNFPQTQGFWVWEGSIIIETSGPQDAALLGEWRRATTEEIRSWDASTRAIS